MAGQNAFLVHLCLFMCYQISVFLVVLVVLVVVVLFVCCCCFVVVTVVVLTLILFGSVCVVHGCVCLLTLRLASLSHFSYLQHSLFILGKVYIPLGF